MLLHGRRIDSDVFDKEVKLIITLRDTDFNVFFSRGRGVIFTSSHKEIFGGNFIIR